MAEKKVCERRIDSMSLLPDLTTTDFDKVPGDHKAITDTPANMFGKS